MKQRACLFAHIYLPPALTMEVRPPDLSQDYKRIVFDELDMYLNTMILQALLYGKSILVPEVSLLNIHFSGLYTGIVSVTFWTICM